MGRSIFRLFQCEMESEYITVSRLLLAPVAKGFESIKNWFQLIYPNLSWLQYCILLPNCLQYMISKHLYVSSL